MGALIRVEKYGGEVVAVNRVPYIQTARSLNYEEFPLLSGIDIYGRTVFNRMQTRKLKGEVSRLMDNEDSSEVVEALSDLSRLCDCVIAGPQHFLWIYGD